MSVGRDDDPTDFDGIYPSVLPVKTKKSKEKAAVASQAAGIRAITAQAVAFYFRAPAKAFFRTRVDYLQYARNLQQRNAAVASDNVSRRLNWLRSTTPGVIASAVRSSGWRVVPDQIVPPFLANLSVGAVLYSAYLSILSSLHEESSTSTKRVFPPPTAYQTFSAGLIAGVIQSGFSAPLDAVQIRYERLAYKPGPGTKGQPQSMWVFGKEKLRDIGVRGIFAGYGLSLLKDSFGSAIFFSTFEYVKAQGYYRFIQWYYGSLHESTAQHLANKRPVAQRHQYSDNSQISNNTVTIKPHFAWEPAFLALAGVTASIAQSSIIYPIHKIQTFHFDHLEELDESARKLQRSPRQGQHWRMMRSYYRAYSETWQTCRDFANKETNGRMSRWLYRGFVFNTLRNLPSTSAGLIIFEVVRRRYGLDSDDVHITSKNGNYNILLQ